MVNKKIGNIVVSLSLLSNLIAPKVLAEEQVLESSQIQFTNQLVEDILSDSVSEETKELNQEDEETEVKRENLDEESEEGDIDSDVIDNELEGNDEELGSEVDNIREEIDNQETSQITSVDEVEDLGQDSESDPEIIDQGMFSGGEWKFYSDGLLTISGGFSYSSSSPIAWSEHIKSVKKVEFIVGQRNDLSGSFASFFRDYENLESVDFGACDISKVTSFERAFEDLTNLKNVTFKDVVYSDTSSHSSTAYMFYGCRNLTTLDLSGFDTSSVNSMGSMFFNCSSLTTLDLSGFDTSSVTLMSNMFSGCSSLMTLDLSGFDTSSVTNMHSMFKLCESLEELDLNGFDTSSVKSMNSMFAVNNSNLTTLDLSGFDTSSVTDMSSMFRGCENILIIHVGANFEFKRDHSFPALTPDYLWQDDNNKMFFYSSDDMISYHNESKKMNTYRKVRYFEVNIPAKISLNNEIQLKVSGTNIGGKTLEVNLKNDSNEIDNESQLLLSNKKDSNVKATSQLSWEPMKEQSKWNILQIAPAENGSSKESIIHLTKPKNVQAGSYEGTLTFEITYE